MKKLISHNGAYKVYAEIDKVSTNDGKSYLKFSTVYEDAASDEPYQKFITFLSDDERKLLKDMM